MTNLTQIENKDVSKLSRRERVDIFQRHPVTLGGGGGGDAPIYIYKRAE